MPQSIPSRRSTRRRHPIKRYSADPLAGLDIFNSEDEEADHEDSDVKEGLNDRSQSDKDFELGPLRDDAEVVNEDDDTEDDNESHGAPLVSDQSSLGIPDLDQDGDEMSLGQGTEDKPERDPSKDSRAPRSEARAATANMSTPNRLRGLQNKPTKSNFGKLLREGYGEHQAAYVSNSIAKFMTNVTFPLKTTARHDSQMAYPLSFDAVLGNNDCRTCFDSVLVSSSNSEELGFIEDRKLEYLPKDPPVIRLVVPPNSRIDSSRTGFIYLPFLQTLSLSDYLGESRPALPISKVGRRVGDLINVGAKILSLSWAPADADGPQYLAVAAEQKDSSPGQHTPFVFSETYKSSIQIWKFLPRQVNADGLESETFLPALARVICTEWGGCRRLKWCPIITRSVGPTQSNEAQIIGRLASIWTDGHIRVIEVTAALEGEKVFQHYKSSVFTAKPPASVCTCIEWVSSNDLAAGCANGYLAIWSMSGVFEDAAERLEENSYSIPYLFEEISETYILEISSAAPLSPHILGFIAVSGHIKLVDLRQPMTDQVTALRSRLYATSIRFSPHIQGFYTTDDQNDVAVLLERRFFSAKRVLPTVASPAGGVLLATSPVHTSILVGTPDGKVSCTNPIRKQVDTRKANAWVQTWFMHEWRATHQVMDQKVEGIHAVDSSSVNTQEAARGEEAIEDQPWRHHTERPTVRLTEGYKIEKLGGVDRKGRNLAQPTTIFNEEQAVTSLEWNPNVECGGWAACGLASGLLRVEDIAI